MWARAHTQAVFNATYVFVVFEGLTVTFAPHFLVLFDHPVRRQEVANNF